MQPQDLGAFNEVSSRRRGKIGPIYKTGSQRIAGRISITTSQAYFRDAQTWLYAERNRSGHRILARDGAKNSEDKWGFRASRSPSRQAKTHTTLQHSRM